MIDDEGECDEGKIPESVFGSGSPILVPHPRFQALGLNLALPPPTSGWNPVVSHPWMPQFRSPLNPFIPREYFSLYYIHISHIFMALCFHEF